jgi:hypothetical protein
MSGPPRSTGSAYEIHSLAAAIVLVAIIRPATSMLHCEISSRPFPMYSVFCTREYVRLRHHK